MTHHDDIVYLRHIFDATVQIQDYLHDVDEKQFKQTGLLQDGIIRQLEIIGEATRHVSKSLRTQYPKVPWQDIAGMRDKLIHGYFGVDLTTVWLTATQDIPTLQKNIKLILSDFGIDV
jgi:uncharacterized protein with HEPN domain